MYYIERGVVGQVKGVEYAGSEGGGWSGMVPMKTRCMCTGGKAVYGI